MTTSAPPQPPVPEPFEQEFEEIAEKILRFAMRHHHAGQMQIAEELYRSILELRPNHAGAHYHLGLLEAQTQRLPDGIVHFETALTAQPEQEQYWRGYIDALTQAGHTEVAQKVLALGRQYGLQDRNP